MDVTSENFREVLPLVFQAIDDADFVSFDGEFSGLRRSTAEQAYSIIDTVEERYNKMAASVREFGFIQFGLSCFKFINDKHTYETATFSFYLLKEKTKMSEPNTFTVCSNSLRFLANANFDFNKLFKEGLPYLNLKEAHFLRDQLPQKIDQHLGYNIEKPSVPDICMSLYNLIVKQIKKDTHEMNSQSEASCEMTNSNSSNGGSCNTSSTGIVFSSRPSPDDLIQCPLSQLHSPQNYIPPSCRTLSYNLNNFKRQCWETLRVVLVKAFPNVDATIDYGSSAMAVLVFANRDDRDLYVYYSMIDKFYNKVGFSHVVTHLLSVGKPLVGHNCILDVLHIVDKCLEPLPLTLEEFKELYRANFSAVYDTKVLFKEAPFAHELDNTALENVYTTVVSSKYCPIVRAMAGQSSYTLSSESLVKQHDGGYDAFITGVAFAGITRRLSSPRGLHHSTLTFNHLEKFKDRSHLIKICDLESIHLSGEDDPVDRRGVLVVTTPVNVRLNIVRTFFPDLTNPIIVTDGFDKCFYVLPANEKDKVMAPSLINKARFIAGPAVTVSLYVTPALSYQADAAMEAVSPSSPAYHGSMKGSENQLLSISIPPSLPVSPQSPDGSLLCSSPPMTPRTAYHLANISTLSAKSPEFTPSAKKGSSESLNTASSKKLYSNIVSEPQQKMQTAVKQGVAKVHHACSTADSSTERCNSSKGKVLESDESDENSAQELRAAESTQPEASTLSKRGEKRKSKNYNDYSKNPQQCSGAATGFRNQRNHNFQAKGKDKQSPNDWKTVSNNRNRNKKSWRDNKFSSQSNNRFRLITNDEETGLESPEPQSIAEGKWCGTASGKRSETGRSKRSLAGASDDDAGSDVPVATVSTALEDTPHADRRRLKRLKSVGAEKLSEMSLNSPTTDQKPFADPFHEATAPLAPIDASSSHFDGSANSGTIVTRSLRGLTTAPAATQPSPSRRRSKSGQLRTTRTNPNTEETQNGDGDVFVVPDQW